MKDKAIGELRAVMKIDVELYWHYIVLEVFDEHVSHPPKNAGQPILLEPLDKHIVIDSNQFRHYVQYTFTNDPFFCHSKDFTCYLIAICEASDSFIIIIGEYGKR